MKRVLMLLAAVLIIAQIASVYSPVGPVDASPVISSVGMRKAEAPAPAPAPAPEVTPEPAPEVKPEPEPKRPDPKPGYRYECGPYGCKLVPILPSTTVEAAPVQCQGGQCYTQPSVRYQPVRSYGPVRTWFKNRRR